MMAAARLLRDRRAERHGRLYLLAERFRFDGMLAIYEGACAGCSATCAVTLVATAGQRSC